MAADVSGSIISQISHKCTECNQSSGSLVARHRNKRNFSFPRNCIGPAVSKLDQEFSPMRNQSPTDLASEKKVVIGRRTPSAATA